MESAIDYNPVLATLHRMHRQFSDLMDQVNGDIRRIRALEERILQLKKMQETAVKSVLDQRILLDHKQALLEANEKSIEKRKKQQDEANNEREFNGIRDQIAAAEAANAVLSDEILEGLDYLDSLKQQADEARANVQKTESLLAEMKSKGQEVRAWAESEIKRIKVDFRAEEAKLNGEHRMLYQRLFGLKKFDSLAPINGKCCAGCHTSIPVDQIANIAESRTPVACPLCGRMLYLPENYHV